MARRRRLRRLRRLRQRRLRRFVEFILGERTTPTPPSPPPPPTPPATPTPTIRNVSYSPPTFSPEDAVRQILDDLRAQIDEAAEDSFSLLQDLAFQIEDLEEQLESILDADDPTSGELFIMAKEVFQEREDWERYESGAGFADLPEDRQDWIREERGITSVDDILSEAEGLSLEDFL